MRKERLLLALMFALSGCAPVHPKRLIPQPLLSHLSGVPIKWVVTKDDWEIALHHYTSKNPKEGAAPVILCHGLGYNGHFWELGNQNFAKFLSDRGYDVWVLDMRGAGFSTKPGWTLLHGTDILPQKVLNRRFDTFNWTVDDHILKDLPKAIDLVKKETGSEKVNWIGHSLGGMVMYGYLMRIDRGDVKNLVAIATPMMIPQPPSKMLKDLETLRPVIMAVNNRFNAFIGVATGGQIATPIDVLFYNRNNVDLLTLLDLHATVAEDIAPGVMDQLLGMVKTGDFRSIDGSYNYTANLGKIRLPTLLIAGKLDNLAPPESVRYAYHHISSDDKHFELFGVANGYYVDYGHDDLIIGRRAKDEVFPLIARWLDKRK